MTGIHPLAMGEGVSGLRSLQESLGHASRSSTQVHTTVDATHLLDVYYGAIRGPDNNLSLPIFRRCLDRILGPFLDDVQNIVLNIAEQKFTPQAKIKIHMTAHFVAGGQNQLRLVESRLLEFVAPSGEICLSVYFWTESSGKRKFQPRASPC